jgi:hypothetical protein
MKTSLSIKRGLKPHLNNRQADRGDLPFSIACTTGATGIMRSVVKLPPLAA